MAPTLPVVGLLCACLLLLLAAPCLGHTVVGYIINDTNMSYSLTQNSTTHGDLKTSPSATLAPLSQTYFELTSPLWNDRILYSWAYTPAEDWCPTYSGAVGGSYQYLFGDNTCAGSQAVCGAAGSMEVVVQNCQKPVGTSYPTFNIHVDVNSTYGG